MNFFKRILPLFTVLIVIFSAQSVNARQPEEVRALIDDMTSIFEDFEDCALTASETSSGSSNSADEIESPDMENIANYMQNMRTFRLCDENARNYMSATREVSAIQFDLLRWRGKLGGIENCVHIKNNIMKSIDALADILREASNFTELSDCSVNNNSSRTYKVTGDGLSLRKMLRKNSKRICLIPKGATVFDNRNKIGEWYEVIYLPDRRDLDRCKNTGQILKGWVHSNFLSPE